MKKGEPRFEIDASATTRGFKALLPAMGATDLASEGWSDTSAAPLLGFHLLQVPTSGSKNALTLFPSTALLTKSPSRATHDVSTTRHLNDLEPDRSTCTRFPA
jgi:hypothetical protein